MLRPLCICDVTPRLTCATRLVLLIHRREIRKPTNTGTLAARSLVGSEVHVIGEEGKPIDYRQVVSGPGSTLFLFPAPHAAPLTPELARGLRGPVRLIVPDGNWGQAGRVVGKIPTDAPVTFVTLPAGPPTQYRLRRESRPMPSGLATLEAIARAMDVLEGPAVSGPLLDVFRIFVERTLWSRGTLRADQVHGGIPGQPRPLS